MREIPVGNAFVYTGTECLVAFLVIIGTLRACNYWLHSLLSKFNCEYAARYSVMMIMFAT